MAKIVLVFLLLTALVASTYLWFKPLPAATKWRVVKISLMGCAFGAIAGILMFLSVQLF